MKRETGMQIAQENATVSAVAPAYTHEQRCLTLERAIAEVVGR